MAIGVDNVYQQVLAIANKEQRGYITPQEFNLFARKAQNDIFEKTFIEYKDAFLNPASVMQSHKNLDMLREKIAPFRVTNVEIDIDNQGVGTFSPALSDIYWIESVYHFDIGNDGTWGDASMVFEEIDKKRVNFLEKYKSQTGFPLNIDHLIFDDTNGLKFSTINTYYREGTDKLYFYPKPYNNASPAVEINPKCDYVKTIASMGDPKWAFTVVNGKALYDASSTGSPAVPKSTDFVLHSSEEGNLINKILEMAGISMGKADLTQSALQNQATNMQQQVQKSYQDPIDNSRTTFLQDQFPYGNKQQPPRR